jgi:hypothetical protein
MNEEVVPVRARLPVVRLRGARRREFGVPVDEEGLAGRECALVDPDGNRLRVATRRA